MGHARCMECMALAEFELAEFESATAWFDVLPQKNKSTNKWSSQIIIMQPVSGGGGGGGGGGFLGHLQDPILYRDNSRTKKSMQGFMNFVVKLISPVVQSSSPVQ